MFFLFSVFAFFENSTLKQVLLENYHVIITSLVWLAILGIGYRFLHRYLIRLSSQSHLNYLQKTAKRIKWPVFMLSAAIVIEIVLLLVEEEKMPLKLSNSLANIVVLLFIWGFTWALILSIHVLKNNILYQYKVNDVFDARARAIHTQFEVLTKVLIVLIILFATGGSLMIFKGIRQVGVAFFTSAGVAGIMIGFASQKVLGSILAGIQIAITQPIRIGDTVVVEKEFGVIESIHLTFVSVRLWDKRRMILPSSYFIEQPFQNWTRESTEIRGAVFLFTDFMFPIDELRKAVFTILDASRHYWDGITNEVHVLSIKPNGIEIRIIMGARNADDMFELRYIMREKLIRYIQENYPQYFPKSSVIAGDANTNFIA